MDRNTDWLLCAVEGRDTLGLKIQDEIYPVEELVSMVLAHVRQHGEAVAGSAIKDCVITGTRLVGWSALCTAVLCARQ